MTLFRHEQSFLHLHDLPATCLFKKILVAVSWAISELSQLMADVAELFHHAAQTGKKYYVDAITKHSSPGR